MSTKIDESNCESATGVVESSCNFEDTIKPSDEFLQAFKLTYPFSKNSNKYNKKYIRTIEVKIDKLFHKVIKSQHTKFEDIITLAYICEHICFAYIKLNRIEMIPAASNSILRCLYLIKNKELDPKIILLTLKAYSHLIYIYRQQKKLKSAIEIIDKAIDLYLTYMEENSKYGIPIDYEDIIIKPSVQINGYIKLKPLYTFILEISIYIHSKMRSKANETFMLSYHLLLIDNFNYFQGTEEYVEWIEKATIVCNYLITCNRFAEARSYINQICNVQNVVHEKYFDIKTKGSLSEISIILNQSLVTSKLIILCCIRYGVALFYQSVERLLRLEKDEVSEANNSITDYSKLEGRAPRRLLIFALNKEAYYDTNTYHSMPFTYILKYNEAQKQFVKILNVIYRSGRDADFVEDINLYIRFKLYISNAYKYMAFYEKETANQFSLRKRRVEILEIAANALEDKSNCKLMRLLLLQLTIAYSILIDMKLEDIEAINLPYLSQKQSVLTDEINILVAKSLIFLRKYTYSK
ncbi:uncharacterized protein LOC116840386 isoform X3 [Odontomachus brunneus]|uniref:uncharacterized protein LOC116840386 isoform X3 n=1 Tax=Odontomachus brunneus TaxID=486640 RepID=UPI0013F2B160|nr:uncharacterized protein LOC116840386 isoform X3 [Odontomachus brunneus]